MKNFDPSVFANYCKQNLNLKGTDSQDYRYKSLPACILDCIYSLRAKYYYVTVPVVDRYAKEYMNGDRFAEGDTLDDFIARIKKDGYKKFAAELLKNNQVLSYRLKSEVCLDLAEALLAAGIHTIEDFQKLKSDDSSKLSKTIRRVKGVGDAAESYIFMLTGDQNRCKPDVHLLQCMKDAYGCKVNVKDCQPIMEKTIDILRVEYPSLTVRTLDALIWEKYRV